MRFLYSFTNSVNIKLATNGVLLLVYVPTFSSKEIAKIWNLTFCSLSWFFSSRSYYLDKYFSNNMNFISFFFFFFFKSFLLFFIFFFFFFFFFSKDFVNLKSNLRFIIIYFNDPKVRIKRKMMKESVLGLSFFNLIISINKVKQLPLVLILKHWKYFPYTFAIANKKLKNTSKKFVVVYPNFWPKMFFHVSVVL